MRRTHGKIILITTPKGGSGKTTTARLLLSEAVKHRPCLGIDLDPQRNLSRWAERRAAARRIEPALTDIKVTAMDASDWRKVIEVAREGRLTVIDTPPGVESFIAALDALQEAADLVLVPCGCTQDDVDSCGDWAQVASGRNRNTAVLLNKADRRRRAYSEARDQLIQLCHVSPIEIPNSEDVHTPFGRGLAPADFPSGKKVARAASAALWSYVRREVGL